jgi:YidC/Oxa1 family membrane protein insertase
VIHVAAGSVPVVSDIFQVVLDTIGWVLARIYDVVPSYGVSIILLTLVVRLLLLPLGIKQIRSMHNMQTLQPKIKAVQTKYKGNRQKAQEEVMKLYKETGVNPLSGCWPVLLQFPILIAMYAVLRPPVVSAESNHTGQMVTYTNNHLPPSATFPQSSTLFDNVTNHVDMNFLGMNLQCAAIKAGTGNVTQTDSDGNPVKPGVKESGGGTVPQSIDCGTGIPVRIPFYLFLVAMIGTTYYQQRQMQSAAPPGAQNAQQQALFKLMPLMFGVFGIAFPSALVLYWVTSNAWQIGQQSVMLRLGHIGPSAQNRPVKPSKPGLFTRLQERAAAEGERRRPEQGKGRPASGKGRANQSKGKRTNGGSSSKRPSGSSRDPKKGKGGRPGGGSSGNRTPKRGPKKPPGGGPKDTPPTDGSNGADDDA